MKFLKASFLETCLFLLCLALVNPLQLFATPLPSVDQSRHALDALVSKVKFYELSNGLRVILYRRGIAPVFSGAVAVRVGGSDELIGQTGISHMFEHMAFKGTQRVGTSDYNKEKPLLAELDQILHQAGPGKALNIQQQKRWGEIHTELKNIWRDSEFSRLYEGRGASDMNASTDKELTRYFVSLPRESFEFWCYMESERLLDPVMRQFYQERDVVLEERRMRFENDPQGKLYEALLQTVFRVHPYKNPVIGYENDIRSLTASSLDEFRKHYYVPGNIAISLVGDIDADRDIRVIEKYFGRLPIGPLPKRPTQIEPEQSRELKVDVLAKASPQLILSYRKPNYPHPDDPPLTVLLEMLAGSRVSPMYIELVKKQQIVATIGYDEAPGAAYPNIALFYMLPKAPHTNADAVAAFDKVLKDFVAAPIDEVGMQIAKRAYAMEYLQHMSSNISLAVDFASSELIYNDWKSIVEAYDKVMAVKVDDIKRVAIKYLVPESRTVAALNFHPASENRGGSR